MSKGTIKPLRDLVLIELDQPEKETITGILLNKAWEDAVSSATVLDAGPDASLKKNDRVHINPYAYIDITGSEFKLIKEGDILGHVI